jgi:Transglycosylase associated protein
MARAEEKIDTFTIPEGRRRRVYRPGRKLGARRGALSTESMRGKRRTRRHRKAKGRCGAFVATYLGQAIGWYRPDEGAGLIGAVVGAIIVLVIWGLFAGRSRTV